jgi:N-acyl-D-amino-acid deacylase
MAADLVVLDPEAFSERGSVFEPNVLATGVRELFVNGVATMHDGHPTGERAGKVVRSVDD